MNQEIKLNYYAASSDKLERAFCLLAEKSYYTSLRTNIIIHDLEMLNQFDRALWTYSKKHFIAHGTFQESYRERHPLYITNDINEYLYNSPNIILSINFDKNMMLDLLSRLNDENNQDNIDKILFLSEPGILGVEEFYNLIAKSQYKDCKNGYFVQANSEWLYRENNQNRSNGTA